jgi:hypothetical protein
MGAKPRAGGVVPATGSSHEGTEVVGATLVATSAVVCVSAFAMVVVVVGDGEASSICSLPMPWPVVHAANTTASATMAAEALERW